MLICVPQSYAYTKRCEKITLSYYIFSGGKLLLIGAVFGMFALAIVAGVIQKRMRNQQASDA